MQCTGCVRYWSSSSNYRRVTVILQDSLEDKDTYIYLLAINGLVACASFDPDLVVNLLTGELGNLDEKKYLAEKGMEIRTKIGMIKFT